MQHAIFHNIGLETLAFHNIGLETLQDLDNLSSRLSIGIAFTVPAFYRA